MSADAGAEVGAVSPGWGGAAAAAVLSGTPLDPLAVRAVLARHGRPPQPDPGSYGAAELVAWLSVTAYSPGDRAALELLASHRGWLEREDWRTLCVVVVDACGRRSAVVDWPAWAQALEDYRRYQDAPAAAREGMPVGLHHSDTAAVVAHMALWLSRDPLGLRRLDLVNTRRVASAVATACGHSPGLVFGCSPDGVG